MNTSEMTDKLRDWQRRAGETARQVGEVTDDYVHDNAWSTIVMAAILGCVVGYLLASRD
jgi:ElaB/YqjD/DUF883 family membrane-anchored ribosome-binding protein